MADGQNNTSDNEIFSFETEVNGDVENWATLLVRTLTQSISQLHTQNKVVSNQIEQLQSTLDQNVQQVKQTADDALSLAQKNATSIDTINLQLEELKAENKQLKSENAEIKQRTDDLEIYSRKKNIVIKGIPETVDEDGRQCLAAVKSFFKTQLKFKDDRIDKMKFDNCHRLGAKQMQTNVHSRVNHRDVVVRFVTNYDKREVFGAGLKYLSDKREYSIHDHFPVNVGYNRRKLYPIYSVAKKHDDYRSVSLKGDRLYIDGQVYTVDNLNKLPDNIHPKNLCTKTDNDRKVLVSGGTLSEYSFLSNYYWCDLVYDNIKYPTLEHAYQHLRALKFNDNKIASQILRAKDAAEAKRLSYRVRGFNDSEWSKVKKNYMLKLLRIKFAPQSELSRKLLATGDMKLAETGRDGFFSCGMSLTHRDVLDSSKWNSNILGNLQMEIRQELK